MTIITAKRLPRKLKKKLIKEFGREAYYKILRDDHYIYQAKIICDWRDGAFTTEYKGHTIFYKIE